MTNRPGVGVIGLGRRWNRYRPALAGAESLLAVHAVWDPLARRAGRVAREFGCEAADGVEDLLDRPDLDAVLLLDPPWHGLWPLQRAVRAKKAVFLAAPLTGDDGHADEIVRLLDGRPQPSMTAFSTEFIPAAVRLRVLLEKHLGPARSVTFLGQVSRQVSGESILQSGALLLALQLCRDLLAGAPHTIWAAAPAGGAVANVTLAFPDGRSAVIVLSGGRGHGRRVEVTAERGSAEAVLPRKLKWRDSAGEHALRVHPFSTPKEMLRQFAECLVGARKPLPPIGDSLRALEWLRAARRSHAENRPVRLGAG